MVRLVYVHFNHCVHDIFDFCPSHISELLSGIINYVLIYPHMFIDDNMMMMIIIHN